MGRALDHYRAAEAVLSKCEERAPLCYVYIGLASAALWGMRTEEGLAASEQAVAIAERLGSEALWAHAATQRAYHLWASGRIRDGIELGERAWLDGRTASTTQWPLLSLRGRARRMPYVEPGPGAAARVAGR